MSQEFARWDDIDIHFKGHGDHLGGPRFRGDEPAPIAADPPGALRRARRRRSASTPRHRRSRRSPAEYDLVVGSDGVNSATRARYAESFGPHLDVRRCKFMWLGTDLVFDAFKFYIVETPYGVMQIHGYPFDATGSTFIVEMNDAVWQRAGFASTQRARSHRARAIDASIAEIRTPLRRHPRRARGPCQQLALDQLHHGAQRRVVARQRRAPRRRRPYRALLHRLRDQARDGGCARARRLPARAHRASSARARRVRSRAQTGRRVDAARGAGEPRWFENLGQYVHQDPMQFAFNILTRSTACHL